jgi:prepilin-type processing-associated H-X9-DG protein
LARYTASALGIYKCPADKFVSPAQKARGWTQRLRSNAMNRLFGLSENGDPNTTRGVSWSDGLYRQFRRTTDVPQPTMTWLTVDEHPDSINDGFFVADNPAQWGDTPASYHNGACGFSFADGHAEIKKWQSPKSIYPVKFADGVAIVPFGNDPAGKRDMQWYRDRVGYTPLR